MSYEVDYACLTDAGKINLINEDNTSIFRNAKGDILMVVADGIGGRKKGDYASKIVIDYFSNSFIKKNGFFCIFTAKYWLKKKIK